MRQKRKLDEWTVSQLCDCKRSWPWLWPWLWPWPSWPVTISWASTGRQWTCRLTTQRLLNLQRHQCWHHQHQTLLYRVSTSTNLIITSLRVTDASWAVYHNSITTPCFRHKLDPLLFHHIFVLTAANCMKIFRYIGDVACYEYGINVCDLLAMLCQ